MITKPNHTISGTRALKNARKIQSLAPDIVPATEPPEGFASVLAFEILSRFHRMSEEELAGHPNLAQLSRQLHNGAVSDQRVTPHGIIFADDPFKGTLYLAKISFKVGANTRAVADSEMATMLQYLNVAAPAIAKYCSQYGENRLAVSSKILSLSVDLPSAKYNDDTLQGWVRTLLAQVHTPIRESCVIVCNPIGVVNSDGDPAQGIGGYHSNVVLAVPSPTDPFFLPSPYCFVNVSNQLALSVADRVNSYAEILSHEVAEMTVDPYASWTNPEVSDGCAGNCSNRWLSFFTVDASGGYTYLRSELDIPPTLAYDFFTAAVAQPSNAGDCPAPQRACAYAPSATAGIGELLFYEKADGYAELYSVDGRANISLQTTHPEWRNSWSLIVPGRYASKPAGGRQDLLFYDRGASTGEFYQTGKVGDMHRFSLHTNWRNSWSIIVPGSFAAPGSMDLLFYEASHGAGEFYSIDGRGNISLIRGYSTFRTSWSIILTGKFSNSASSDLLFYDPIGATGEFYSIDGRGNLTLIANHSNWRTSWSIIVAGKFSDSPYSDLLFYDPTSGVGEFYSTDGRGNLTLIANHSNWRTSWSSIVTGKFSNSAYSDLLFYDPAAGVGEFYRTDGRANISSIQNHTNWRTTWSIVASL
jgi:hypothetical protein